ncbi:MAG TPA: hypothetical protein PKB06_05890, partial [Actinotalea sp.]|nr:hypothetical protein [Actinotalea sp.]
AWGTRIEVSCSYAAVGDAADGGPGGYDGGYDGGNDPGAPTDAVYGLVVRGDDGGSEQVASWTGVPGHEITVPAASRRRMAEIASISLVGADGQVLLTAEL